MLLSGSLPPMDVPSFSGFDWGGDVGRDPEPEWTQAGRFLSRYGLLLYGTPEFDQAPPAPDSSAVAPFSPQDNEDFVFRLAPQLRRTGRDIWDYPTPFVQLAVDSRGREVIIKAVPPLSPEARITQYLTSPSRRVSPGNHTIPVVSILRHPCVTFLVQARWGNLYYPDVPTVAHWATVVLYQLLEGLTFMHDLCIAHMDIHPGNILCNFHDFRSLSTPCPVFEDFKRHPSFRLAFIDFGASIPSSEALTFRSVRLMQNAGPPPEFRAPELDQGNPFDPFPVDVFSLGRVFSHLNPPARIPIRYQNLIDDMTNPAPMERPTAHLAFERLKTLNGSEVKRDGAIPE
ncbi:kinase-like domain-containing protein [Mycena latifolia]|nr:kinase-like domain-containing protein [Mycena latifolia]